MTKQNKQKKYFALTLASLLAPSLHSDELTTTKNQYLDKIVTSAFSTKLDELNRNVYTIDKDMLTNKGYTSTEDAFHYVPFVGFSNNGNGANIDLRGQGINANVSTQVLLNGVQINMLDSSHGVTPLQSINVHSIETVEILPGGGAVMYGNGTRGGVINIITKRRYSSLYINSGINYKYSNGLNQQVDLEVASPLGKNLYGQFSVQSNVYSGYRDKDKGFSNNLSGSLTYDISERQSLAFDVSYYGGKQYTTPVLRFSQYPVITSANRFDAGTGNIILNQDRFSTSLEYQLKIADNQKLKVTGYYQYYNSVYSTNLQTMDYLYRSMTLSNTGVNQDGSYFTDEKLGLKTNYQLTHKNGLFILGYDFLYNRGLRNLPLVISWDGSLSMMGSTVTSYHHSIHTFMDAKKFTNAIYAIEKYDFTKVFSLTGGLRYELANYAGYRRYDGNGTMNMNMPNNGGSSGGSSSGGTTARAMSIDNNHYIHAITGVRNNVAAELTPRFQLSKGDIYLKYEHGFRSPNPDNLTDKQNGKNYTDNNLKSENYDTFEIGGKYFPTDNLMFMATIYYTLTHNEIFTTGSPHSGFGYATQNLDLTHRAGIEIASEQTFFSNKLSLTESFTYIDARILRSSLSQYKANDLIPYVSNYKATINVNYQISKNFGVYTQNSFNGAQRDTAQNLIKAYILTDIGVTFSAKHFSVTAGITNVFNTFYYTFYNADSSDSVVGLAFLPAAGRSYFIQGRYKF